MASLDEVVVVGASLAGWRAAEALRRRGFDGRLTLVGEEKHLPYDRPPLSKQLLFGEQEPEDLLHAERSTLAALQVEFLPGRKATRLDLRAQRVFLSDGESRRFDAVVVATGASPIRPSLRWLPGVQMLRTLDEALMLRAAFSSSPRVLIVGAGFIGLEVAWAARKRGLGVTVVEAQPLPLLGAVGPVIGAATAELARSHGVRLILGVGVASIEGDERVERVRLNDSETIDADLVVVGVGVRPNTGWLHDSGLLAGPHGVRCGKGGLAEGQPRVYGAGDVARWYKPRLSRHARIEHWTNAVEHGELVARNILQWPQQTALAGAPYFWSDQFETRIQMVGYFVPEASTHVVHGSIAEGHFVAILAAAGQAIGAIAFNEARLFAQYRRLLTQPTSHEQVREHARRLSEQEPSSVGYAT